MRVVFAILILGCAGCTAFPVFESRLSRETIRHDKSVTLPYRVAVRGAADSGSDPAQALTLSNAVTTLRETGLFSEVNTWTPGTEADLIVCAQSAAGAARCGTPFVLYPLTLGLVSAASSYQQHYAFAFVSPTSGRRLGFEKRYGGTLYKPSLLLLPFTLHRRHPSAVDLLRHDLVGVSMGLTLLTLPGGTPAPSDAASDTGEDTRGFVCHRVQKHQDLQEITMLYGVDAETIKRVNGLSGAALREGQILRIPETE